MRRALALLLSVPFLAGCGGDTPPTPAKPATILVTRTPVPPPLTPFTPAPTETPHLSANALMFASATAAKAATRAAVAGLPTRTSTALPTQPPRPTAVAAKPTRSPTPRPVAKATRPPAPAPTAPSCLSAAQRTYLTTVNAVAARVAKNENLMDLYQQRGSDFNAADYAKYEVARKDMIALGHQYADDHAPATWSAVDPDWQEALHQLRNFADKLSDPMIFRARINLRLGRVVAQLQEYVDVCP